MARVSETAGATRASRLREVPCLLRLPPRAEQREAPERHQATHDVDELRPDVVAPEKLHDRKRSAADEDRRPRAHQAAPSAHRGDQPRRNEQRDERQLPAGHRAQEIRRNPRDGSKREDRRADRAIGHRRSIRDERQASGVQRRKAQTHQQRRRDRHWSAESCRAFDEGAKRERNEQRLHPPIGRETRDRCFDDLELAGRDRQAVQEDGVEDDPADREEAIERAVDGRRCRGRHGHAVHDDRNQQG